MKLFEVNVGKPTDWASTPLFSSQIYKFAQLRKRYFSEEGIFLSEILSKNIVENKTKVTKIFFQIKGTLLNTNCVKIPNLSNRKYSENTTTFKVNGFYIDYPLGCMVKETKMNSGQEDEICLFSQTFNKTRSLLSLVVNRGQVLFPRR